VVEPVTYPQRAELIADMCGVLKAARRPLPADQKHYDLDLAGWDLVRRLSNRLARHLSFEHLERPQLQNALRDAVKTYKNPPDGKRPDSKTFAGEVLDGLAQEPLRRTVYLGVRDLTLVYGTTVGNVRFLALADDDVLVESFARFGDRAPAMVCEVEVVGGTTDWLRDRAREAAENALALVRQQFMFGFAAKIYLQQVMFGLDGTYTFRDDSGVARPGWWREPKPMLTDLSKGNLSDWYATLVSLSERYTGLSPELRERVDTCVDWLDVAALSDRWRIIIPAIFSAMESLLVPETAGLKAAVVTVRSVAVHVAAGEGFFDPGDVLMGYQLRSDLVHGSPTTDVPDNEATDFAEFRRLWAFKVFCDYLTLAETINATTVRDIVTHLDSGACIEICAWLNDHGGSSIVEEYQDAIKSGADALKTDGA
jgi:hypothetical protein